MPRTDPKGRWRARRRSFRRAEIHRDERGRSTSSDRSPHRHRTGRWARTRCRQHAHGETPEPREATRARGLEWLRQQSRERSLRRPHHPRAGLRQLRAGGLPPLPRTVTCATRVATVRASMSSEPKGTDADPFDFDRQRHRQKTARSRCGRGGEVRVSRCNRQLARRPFAIDIEEGPVLQRPVKVSVSNVDASHVEVKLGLGGLGLLDRRRRAARRARGAPTSPKRPTRCASES